MWCRRKYWKLLDRFRSLKNPIIRCDSSKPENDVSSSFEISKNDIQKYGIAASFSYHKFMKFLCNNKCSFENGHTCIAVNCKNCSRKNEGLLYVNKITGFFVCNECQSSGHWIHLEPRLSMKTESKSNETEAGSKRKFPKLNVCTDLSDKWNKLTESCKLVEKLPEEEIDAIIKKFELKISSRHDLFKYLDVLYDSESEKLYFPLRNWKKRVVGIKELAVDGSEQCDPFKICYGVLKYIPDKVTKKCPNAILVHNIKDFIAVSSYEPAYHVICIPHGILSLPQEVLPLFEQYTKLIFWFGNSVSSLGAVRMFSRKLLEDRCYLVKQTTDKSSKSTEEKQLVDITNLLNNAEPVLHECVTTFSKLKEEIWAELTNVDCAQGVQWRRFPLINTMLKGHRKGELTILTGPTGCGKTTFLSEYSLDLAMQGVSTLWGSFEIRNQRLAYTMLQQMAMEPLDSNYDKFEHWSREFEKLPIYFLKFHGQQSISTVMKVVYYASYMHDIQHLVIDNLQFMLGLSLNDKFVDRFYQQDMVIAAFRTFSTQRNCHVTLIIHPRKERETDELTISSIFGSAKASQEADNIMIIQKQMLESMRIKKYLQILKNRYTGDLGIAPLNFDKATLTFSGKSSKTKEKIISEQSINKTTPQSARADEEASQFNVNESAVDVKQTNFLFVEENRSLDDAERAKKNI